ncbi:hypothetical protein BG841_01625 [Marinobacter sp. X15-166B]|nr:hypothetical protein BG841_01625 [Marinobacter sp. X15-166B]
MALPGGLIPCGEWKPPAGSVQRTLKEAARNGWRFLQKGFRPDEQPLEKPKDTASLSERQRARYAPLPDWTQRGRELGAALDELEDDGAIKVIVAPPFAGLGTPLELLAKIRGWRIIEPPEDLFMSPQDAASWWRERSTESPWLVPDLAQFWLRHRSGLALIREFLIRVARDEQGQGVVGCSSWCWEFWAHYMPEVPIYPYTLAPLDGAGLADWFTALARNPHGRALRVRMANNDRWALLPDGACDDADKRSTFLQDLAAKARGNSGVALAIWRQALQTEPEGDEDDEDDPAPDPAETPETSKPCDCWVLPLDRITLPGMPGNSSRKLTHLLHAMLLHSGLSEERLALTTGLNDQEVSVSLAALRRAELVVQEGGGWRVTVLGYPAVRRRLQSDGYPLDRF